MGFSTDGDLLGYMMFDNVKVDITRGPVNTSHAMFKTQDKAFAFSIEDTSISPMVADFFATLFEIISVGHKPRNFLQKLALIRRYPSLTYAILFGLSLSSFQKILTKFWNDSKVRNMLIQMARNRNVEDTKNLKLAYSVLHNSFADEDFPYASAAERLSSFFVFSCMGIDNADGMLSLKTDWQGLEQTNDGADKLILDWSPEKNKKIFADIITGMRELADEMEPNGSKNVVAPTWNENKPSDSSLILLHPLGGCSMGDSIENGVVNSYGQVFKPESNHKKKTYPNFYVIDGSIIPTSVGVNTSLTIATIAFRCIDNMIGKQYLPT
jgi:cholesterol oxidase